MMAKLIDFADAVELLDDERLAEVVRERVREIQAEEGEELPPEPEAAA